MPFEPSPRSLADPTTRPTPAPFTPSEPPWKPADWPDPRLPWSEGRKKLEEVLRDRRTQSRTGESSPDARSAATIDQVATALTHEIATLMEPVYADALQRLQQIAPGLTIAPGHPDTAILLRTPYARKVLDEVEWARQEATRYVIGRFTAHIERARLTSSR